VPNCLMLRTSLLLVALSAIVAMAAVPQSVLDSLNASAHDVDRILDFYLRTNPSETFDKLEYLVDTFGSRISGSQQHAKAVSWVLQSMIREGLENVHAEPVMVPKWVRGAEYARMTFPREYKFNMLGLGGSVGTGGKPIKGEVLLVTSFDELRALPREVTQGKIVVYNQRCDWEKQPVNCYGLSVGYRTNGAVEAAKVGAIAALVRTVGAFSIASPHTGHMSYALGVPKIPSAAISIEDAAMVERMFVRGIPMEIELYMEAQSYPDVQSYNVVGEIVGSTYPDEVVLVSGHLDSWDVGQGAMDDGGGAVISWQVLSTLKKLGIRPKRTIRFVGWACEEFGGIGAYQYYLAHALNASKFSLVMESDLGVFKAQGIQFTGAPEGKEIFAEIVKFLKPIDADLVTDGGEGTDIGPWMAVGVPGVSLANQDERYFWYHHSNGDMLTVLNEKDVASCAATWTVSSFLVANLDQMLPRATQA
jgi:carboxypeptidase Q